VEDELLKWKFRRGSPEALSRIYEKYLDQLLTLAMSLVNDAGAAEDIVHDVFVGFARSANGFKLHGSLGGYLATSVVNRVRDRRRCLRRQIAASSQPSGPARESVEPHGAASFAEQAAKLNEAVAELPAEQREVVLLRLKADMKFRDIARLQNTSINTVVGRYRYGLNRLRSTLNGEVEA